jgi:hypothetical protein
VSYSAIDNLAQDGAFNGRVRACTLEQAHVYKDDARPDFVALASDIMRSGPETTVTFVRLVAAAPGLADKATTPEGIDQTRISDADVLSAVQGNWQTVAGLYFDAEGNPVTW